MKNTSGPAKHWSTTEGKRVLESPHTESPWKVWGPYVSEREWGTVREDYSADGNAWAHFTHEDARSRAYRWGEDGLAAICDRYQTIVFSLALWNGKDRILKERAFGVVPTEGNHGEDVKEYYYYLDSTPTHSYMKYLYKYPHAKFPYEELIRENQKRKGTKLPEFELVDTHIFDEDRYFDVYVEYAKASPTDMAIRISVFNRGPEDAEIHVIPQIWFRNQWNWSPEVTEKPSIRSQNGADGSVCLATSTAKQSLPRNLLQPYELDGFFLSGDSRARPLFTDNESNAEHLFGGRSKSRFTKDAFHRQIVDGEQCTNSEQVGTKACLHFADQMVPAGGSREFLLRWTNEELDRPLADVERILDERQREADEFYDALHPEHASEDERRIQRQALAGMLWNKQAYLFDVDQWTKGDDPNAPPPAGREKIRNVHWKHLNSMRVLSMPDKWEFPWFAAWDSAFHCIPLALVDPGFAKEQLWLFLFEQFLHPNGQIPAYEWEFSDINPPVHAWAVWRVYNMERISTGKGDRQFLEQCFHKLLLNFTWWVNKVDSEGNNVFEGGFLGLDNITVIERSSETPEGAILEQSDATGWMGMYSLNMMRIALALAKENDAYEALATKFFEHYVYIGAAMKRMGRHGYQLWDEKDGFFYDVLRYPDGHYDTFRVRSLVGLVPLFAVERLEENWIKPFKKFRANLHWFLRNRQDIVDECVTTLEHDGEQVHVLTVMKPKQVQQLLERIQDPDEFRSPFGMRSMSKYHEKHPFTYGSETVRYESGESASVQKGGNSNWRGPVWMPTTFLMIETLRKLRKAYRDDFRIPAPGPGDDVTLQQMASDLAHRLIGIFTSDASGKRPVFGGDERFEDEHWRDNLLFFEHFDADSGRGLGASHQTGWTGLVASLIDEWRE